MKARPRTFQEHLDSYPKPTDCPYCDGEGEIIHKLTREELAFASPFDTICPQCNGQGLIPQIKENTLEDNMTYTSKLSKRIGDRTHGATLSECEQWADEVRLKDEYIAHLESALESMEEQKNHWWRLACARFRELVTLKKHIAQTDTAITEATS